jgi:hypothetical protein
MLIDGGRFTDAVRRLALKRRVPENIERLDLTRDQRTDIFDKVIYPLMAVKLAQRLWARGHVIVDRGTQEIFRGMSGVAPGSDR